VVLVYSTAFDRIIKTFLHYDPVLCSDLLSFAHMVIDSCGSTAAVALGLNGKRRLSDVDG
jgi:hypothetical protein